MLLLTGASGLVGSELRRRLLAEGHAVRCLVRDPRRLGEDRVRVQIALGDLADPPSFRNALRGVDTVVHLAAAVRDQPQGSIEELSGIATWRLVDAARRAGARRFVFFSALGASTQSRARLLRAKALAEAAVRDSGLETTIFAPSLIYAPGDRYLTLLSRLALVPGAMPFPGRGRARFAPIWVADVADCVMASLARDGGASHRYELAGPQVLTHEQIVRLAIAASGRRRRLVRVPTPLVSRGLRLLERIAGERAFATWDELELMEVSMVPEQSAGDAPALGVHPRTMASVLGLS
jgi:NADH dehydrogenase